MRPLLQLNTLEVRQDIIRARGGSFMYEKIRTHYSGELALILYKSKQELAVYLIHDNPNVRTAAKILIEQLGDKVC